MQQANQKPPRSLSQLIEEFREDITPAELEDILESLRALKRGSGWGGIEMKYLNGDLDTIEVKITRKTKKKTSV